MSRPPALIFDFGNVLAFFDYARACGRFARPLGITPEAFLERVRGRGMTPLLQDYERGGIDSETFARRFCGLAGLDAPYDEFAAAWADIFRLNAPVASLAASLKAKGHTLVLGSNTNALHAAWFRRQFAETLAHFDRLVLSYEVGHLKPAPEFYLACAEAAGRAPADCVFIDDLPENVEGANAAGLRGIVYQDPESLARALGEPGVEAATPAR